MKQQLLKSITCLLLFLNAFAATAWSRDIDTLIEDVSLKPNQNVNISSLLQDFYPLNDSAIYTITACADLPDNDNPQCVYKKGEPGHVFLMLSKNIPGGVSITKSFGFYPKVAVSFLFKKTKSQIKDNSKREYNAAIDKTLTAAEFEIVLEKCKELAKKKYHLKKYNCYDYVLEIFNSIPGIEKLPVSKVKFPFIFGKGGSPCGLYRDLKQLVASGSSWTPFISFGVFISPSFMEQNLLASF